MTTSTTHVYPPEQVEAARRELAEVEAMMETGPAILREAMEITIKRLHAIINGQLPRQFDWIKVARLIAERRPMEVVAGMKEDWFWTASCVYEAGKGIFTPSVDSSVWATPVIQLDDEEVDCGLDKLPGVNPTVWPEEALVILAEAGLMKL